MPRDLAQGFANQLNGALNRTVSDSRLSVREIPGNPNSFRLARVVNGVDVPLELHGTTTRLFVEYVVELVSTKCRTESYSYRLQTNESLGSWLVRWEYVRKPPRTDYGYPLAHVHFNSNFHNGTFAGKLHVPTNPVGLGLVIRQLITDWDVKPRTDDWESMLEESTEGFDEPV